MIYLSVQVLFIYFLLMKTIKKKRILRGDLSHFLIAASWLQHVFCWRIDFFCWGFFHYLLFISSSILKAAAAVLNFRKSGAWLQKPQMGRAHARVRQGKQPLIVFFLFLKIKRGYQCWSAWKCHVWLIHKNTSVRDERRSGKRKLKKEMDNSLLSHMTLSRASLATE